MRAIKVVSALLLAALFALVAPPGVPAQTLGLASITPRVTTVAGPSFGLDGVGAAATLNGPDATAFGSDAAGDFLLIADEFSHSVRRFDLATGLLSTLAGLSGQPGSADGVGGNARFSSPQSVSVSADSSFALVMDRNGVRRLTLANGAVTTILAGGGLRDDVALSADGSFALIADSSGLRRLDLATQTTTLINPLAGYDTANLHVALAFNDSVALVTVYFSHVLLRVNLANGALSVLAGSAGQSGNSDGVAAAARFTLPSGLAVGSDGGGAFVLLTDDNSRLRRVALNTGAVTTLILSGEVPGNNIGGVALSPDASYAVLADNRDNVLRRVQIASGGADAEGFVARLVGDLPYGNRDGRGSDARFRFLGGLVLAPDASYALIADSFNGIRRLQIAAGPTLPGTVTTLLADAAANDIALSPDGNRAIYATTAGTIRALDLSVDPPVASDLAGVAFDYGNVDGVGGAARFSDRNTIAFSPDGAFVLVADLVNQTIRRIDLATNTVTTIAGSPGSPGSANGVGAVARFRFNAIGDVAISSDASFALVSEGGNNLLRRIELASNTVSTVAGSAGASGRLDGIGPAARFSSPQGLALSADDRYALVFEDKALRRVDLASATVTTLLEAELASFTDGVPLGVFGGFIALAADGSFALVSDAYHRSLRRIDGLNVAAPLPPDATGVTSLAGLAGVTGNVDGIGPEARFATPTGVAVSATGIAVVADSENHTIRRLIVATGAVDTIAGQPAMPGAADGQGQAASFNLPTGVAIDRLATVAFVADSANHTIRQIDMRSGRVTTLAGQAGAAGSANGIAAAARFNAPQAVALICSNQALATLNDPLEDCPTLLVADSLNHTIRSINRRTGAVTTLAGTAAQTGLVNAVGAAARFNRPAGISVASGGSFALVADLGNNAIRRIDVASAAVTTLLAPVVTARTGLAQGGAGIFSVSPGCAPNEGFLTNAQTHTLSRLNLQSGAVTLLAGQPGTPGAVDGVGRQARFNGPSGLAISCGSEGNRLLIGDRNNALVREFRTYRLLLPLVQR